jgi:hypothetical protein
MNSEELFTNLREESISSLGLGSNCAAHRRIELRHEIEARPVDPLISQSSIRRTANPQHPSVY